MRTIIQLFNTGVLVITGNMFIYSQNLIQNSSFEQGGLPLGDGWYASYWGGVECGELTNASTDTVCGVTFVQDAPPNGGNWSIHPLNMSLKYYVTNLSSNQIFQLKIWLKEIICGYLDINYYKKNSAFNKIKQISLSGNLWNEYFVIDTLPVSFLSTDTLAIEFWTYCFNDFMPFYADNIEFTLDTTVFLPENKIKKNDLNILVSKNANTITIVINDKIPIKKIDICNLLGQLLITSKKHKVELPSVKGIFLTKVSFENEESIVQKLVIY